tara:strand:+ start:52 stop:1374 length:1323 start_codon:yes stop_codon:yes gene_type:complete
MTKTLESDAYFKTVSILNDILYDEGISIVKTEGKDTVYIWLECDGDRIDTQEEVEHHLKKVAQPKRTYKKSKSSLDCTELSGTNIFIVYKNKKGGMKETTLNSTITELFPAIAFETGISDKLDIPKFYNQVAQKNEKSLGAYSGNPSLAFKAGKEFISKATDSSKFEEKTGNAKAILGWIKQENKRRKISKVVWGYRDNTKPSGVNPKHKGDIFLIFKDTSNKPNIEGVSLKAGGVKTAEPQFNSYVRPIYTSFKMLPQYKKLEQESYDKFYKGIPNIPKVSQYGKSPMTKVIGEFEKEQEKKYEQYYDEQLKWVRQTICDLITAHPVEAKRWLLQEVAKEDPNVPLVVIKATGDRYPQGIEKLKDEDIIKNCVVDAKKNKGIKAYPDKPSGSKQNWFIDLTCETHTTTLKFSIRTNKTGTSHKLGQYINLAVKFNGVKK